jgi:hypothetical protein
VKERLAEIAVEVVKLLEGSRRCWLRWRKVEWRRLLTVLRLTMWKAGACLWSARGRSRFWQGDPRPGTRPSRKVVRGRVCPLSRTPLPPLPWPNGNEPTTSRRNTTPGIERALSHSWPLRVSFPCRDIESGKSRCTGSIADGASNSCSWPGRCLGDGRPKQKKWDRTSKDKGHLYHLQDADATIHKE